jgi:molybdate transport system regulatory protein
MHREKSSRHKKTAASATFRGRVWVDGKDGTFLGNGRVVLLERIREHGSITKAATSMQMAYRHAWDLVDSMNKQAKRPFVELSTGGRGGGGARITEDGELAIQLFWKFSEDFKRFIAREQKKLSIEVLFRK